MPPVIPELHASFQPRRPCIAPEAEPILGKIQERSGACSLEGVLFGGCPIQFLVSREIEGNASFGVPLPPHKPTPLVQISFVLWHVFTTRGNQREADTDMCFFRDTQSLFVCRLKGTSTANDHFGGSHLKKRAPKFFNCPLRIQSSFAGAMDQAANTVPIERQIVSGNIDEVSLFLDLQSWQFQSKPPVNWGHQCDPG